MARLCPLLCGCCGWVCKFLIYWVVGWHFYMHDTWSRFSEPGWACEGHDVGDGQPGVKVIVAALAKSGTRSMATALYQAGLKHTYHSEDFGFYLWGPLADRHWLTQAGGRWGDMPNPGSLFQKTTLDIDVLNATTNEELAAAIARCRVDAVVFDGIERLLDPVRAVSPGAKVIMLNWRSFEEWKDSRTRHDEAALPEILIRGSFTMSVHFLPWGALYRVVDWLLGGLMERQLKAGGPPITQEQNLHTEIYNSILGFRRFFTRYLSGLEIHPTSQESYDQFFQGIKDSTPPEDLFEFDMRRHTFEDLCNFVGVADCKMSGRLPRVPSFWTVEQKDPWTAALWYVALAAVTWVNLMILGLLLSAPRRLLRLRPKMD